MASQIHDLGYERMRRRTEDQPVPVPPGIDLTATTGVTSQTAVLERVHETAGVLNASAGALNAAAGALLRVCEEARGPRTESVGIFRIDMLPNKEVSTPIEAILERDEEDFIARAIELPLYGCGSDPIDAINMLKSEIESLYDDLMEDDNFTDEWIRVKKYLSSRISG